MSYCQNKVRVKIFRELETLLDGHFGKVAAALRSIRESV